MTTYILEERTRARRRDRSTLREIEFKQRQRENEQHRHSSARSNRSAEKQMRELAVYVEKWSNVSLKGRFSTPVLEGTYNTVPRLSSISDLSTPTKQAMPAEMLDVQEAAKETESNTPHQSIITE